MSTEQLLIGLAALVLCNNLIGLLTWFTLQNLAKKPETEIVHQREARQSLDWF